MSKHSIWENATGLLITLNRLKVFTHDPHVEILVYLLKYKPRGQNVTDIKNDLKLEQSICSLHLSKLLKANLVISKKQRRNMYYAPNYEQIVATMKEVCQLFKTKISINRLTKEVRSYENSNRNKEEAESLV